MIEVKISGAELPAAMKVAPATSSSMCKAVVRKKKINFSINKNSDIRHTLTHAFQGSDEVVAANYRQCCQPVTESDEVQKDGTVSSLFIRE